MTTSAQLVERVRTNINEPASNNDPQRADEEIAQWLQDGLYDYVSKVPADAIPETIVQATFSGTYWHVATDFIKALHVIISHGIATSTQTVTATEQCKILDSDEHYAYLYSPAWAGAWAKFDKVNSTKCIAVGPNAYSGTVTYIGLPSAIASCSVTFPLTGGHEEPVVNYATAMALAKINDEDAPRYLERYEMRVAAENSQKYPRRRKVEKEDPQMNEP